MLAHLLTCLGIAAIVWYKYSVTCGLKKEEKKKHDIERLVNRFNLKLVLAGARPAAHLNMDPKDVPSGIVAIHLEKSSNTDHLHPLFVKTEKKGSILPQASRFAIGTALGYFYPMYDISQDIVNDDNHMLLLWTVKCIDSAKVIDVSLFCEIIHKNVVHVRHIENKKNNFQRVLQQDQDIEVLSVAYHLISL